MWAGWSFGALCWSSGKDLVMNKRRGQSRLYSAYVWPSYWNGMGFVYFIGFCDDKESVIGDICCRISNSKPCSVSVEHSAVAEGCLFGVMSLRWSNDGTFCRCVLCHRCWASFKRRAFCFRVSCPSSVRNRRLLAEALMVCFLFFFCILARMYITAWT